MDSTSLKALWIGFFVLRFILRWLKIPWTAVLIRSSSVADSRSLMGKSFSNGVVNGRGQSLLQPGVSVEGHGAVKPLAMLEYVQG